MSPRVRPIIAWCYFVVCLFTSVRASAWVESTITSDTITIDLETSGQAVVAHELVLRVRGGPLMSTELSGVDSDAEPLDGAEVVALNSKSESVPLLLSRGDDDTLHIEVNSAKGLRNGSYAFRFRYRTNLRQKSRIDLRNSWAEVSWIGPRYEAGLDVAKVVFRLPFSTSAPRLPETARDNDDPAEGQSSDAMLSTLRRAGTIDELELVRPHVAKGEPVLWRIWSSATLFPWLTSKDSDAQKPEGVRASSYRAPMRRGLLLLSTALVACVLAVAVWAKSRWAAAEAERQQCVLRPLVRIGSSWRALCAGLLGAAAILLAVRVEAPTFAALSLLGAMACTAHLWPVEPRKLRGPGRWLPIASDEAWNTASRKPVFGAWLDASTAKGKLSLLFYSLISAVAVGWVFRFEPYYAVMLAMGGAVPLPLWLTGCFSELPWARDARARKRLEGVARALTKTSTYRVTVFGRFADGATEPDEVRLRITASTTPSGLLGIEIASTAYGTQALPSLSLLLRVAEGSRAFGEFAGKLRFSRGRTPQERIAIVTFASSPITQIRRLVDEILGVREIDQSSPPHSPTKLGGSKRAARSGAKGSFTSKPSKGGSPPQATRAA